MDEEAVSILAYLSSTVVEATLASLSSLLVTTGTLKYPKEHRIIDFFAKRTHDINFLIKIFYSIFGVYTFI